MFRSFLQRLTGAATPPGPAGPRTSGPPTSSNGASSFHLYWDVAPEPLVEVSATFEVIEPPTVDKLYFWALQVSFAEAGLVRGGAHFGLQYHPSYPDAGAVNWGGYHHGGGGVLDGSLSELPSALDDRNTRTYPWKPRVPYRFRVYRSPERGWRGAITDLASGTETVVRDLWVDGDTLVSPMVWTEAFADCDHPSVAVRWTDLSAVSVDGDQLEISAVRLNYQTQRDGGCANTNTAVDGNGFVQRTSTERAADTGTRLALS